MLSAGAERNTGTSSTLSHYLESSGLSSYCSNKKEETWRTPEHSGCSQALVTCMGCVSSGSHILHLQQVSLCIKNIQPAEQQVALQLHLIGYHINWDSSLKSCPYPPNSCLFTLPAHAAAALYKMQSTCYLYTQLHRDINPTLHLFVHALWMKLVFHLCCLLRLWIRTGKLVYECEHMYRTFLVQWTSRFIDSDSSSLFDTHERHEGFDQSLKKGWLWSEKCSNYDPIRFFS